MRTLPTTLIAALTLTTTIGCATSPSPHDRSLGAQGAHAPAPSPRLAPGVYDVQRGERISREDLYARLATYRFVVVGESHDDAWHHEVERDIYQGVTRRASGEVLLGMEMFQRPYQSGLDRYISGEIDQEAMLEETDWAERWGFDVAFYEPLWKQARAERAPVIALNARRELTKRCAKVGLSKLTEEERALLPAEMDLENRAHRAWVEGIFSAHGMNMDEATFQRFYEAQVIWDETMAETAFLAMKEREGEDVMVIVAGTGHVMNRWGIPSRIARRLGEDGAASVVTVIPVSPPSPATSLAAPSGATLDDLKAWRASGYADYVWVY